ncbi:3-hydroxyacyl-CoA dehydrogenase [Georgenia halophila]|uniref:3-hydroxyacyl-CoA dehydrogenase n=1 Tax=Georgenia halophila TaxID=620889 RepID=A0ABP8LJY5_9MICO
MNISGAGALVVGGASGLGAAVVRRLHDDGAHVVVADRDIERGRALADELGDDVAFVETDVTDEDAVARAVEHADAAGDDGLRISVMCAGIPVVQKTVSRGRAAELEPFRSVIGVNLIGTFNVLRLAAARMAATDPQEDDERGVCINTASIAAFEGQVGQIGYSASKAGVVGMTLPAARDLAGVGIRVNTIAPGTFATPMLEGLPEEAREALAAQIPFPRRLGRPEEFADLVRAIVTNRMINGEVIRLDGGLRMQPR